jgi:hypothetical protein
MAVTTATRFAVDFTDSTFVEVVFVLLLLLRLRLWSWWWWLLPLY